jgi:hypothetical protein
MFPFGFGLSYTSFDYSNLSITTDTVGGKFKCIVSLDIKNTGSVEGAEIAQLYVRDVESSVIRPNKELKAFSKINLAPGQTKTVSMILDINAFAYYSTQKSSFVVDNGNFEIMIGTSSADIKLSGNIRIEDDYLISGTSENVAIHNGFDIYPIPADNVLNFSTDDLSSKGIVEIYDLNGRKLDRFQLNGSADTYNCSKLSGGVYICRFISNNTTVSKRIIIE